MFIYYVLHMIPGKSFCICFFYVCCEQASNFLHQDFGRPRQCKYMRVLIALLVLFGVWYLYCLRARRTRNKTFFSASFFHLQKTPPFELASVGHLPMLVVAKNLSSGKNHEKLWPIMLSKWVKLLEDVTTAP